MLTRFACALGLLALSLTGCQSSKTAFKGPQATAEAETLVVLMHDSQSPEPTAVTVSASEAEATSAKRVSGRRP
ncbi:hypothetical protein [Hymenobacter koreensis]